MKSKIFKRFFSSVLALAMVIGCGAFSTVTVSAEFANIDIDFDTYDMTENVYGLNGTVETIGSEKVLALSEEKWTYLNTGIASDTTGKYELKFSVYPGTSDSTGKILDRYLFGFDSNIDYITTDTYTKTDMCLGYYASTDSVANGLFKYHANYSDDTTNFNARINYGTNNIKANQWYDYTVVFDHMAGTADVTISSEGVTFGTGVTDTYNYTIDMPEGAYFKRLKLAASKNGDTGAADVCYVKGISIKEVNDPEFEEINYTFEDGTDYSAVTVGTVTALDGYTGKALKLMSGQTLTIPTYINAADTEKYEIDFAIKPVNVEEQYIAAFDGNKKYNDSVNDTLHRLLAFQYAKENTGNMFGWASEKTHNGFGSDDAAFNRLQYNYTSQWYNVNAVVDHIANTVAVTVKDENGNLVTARENSLGNPYTITMNEEAYLKSLVFKSIDTSSSANSTNAECYIDDISIKKVKEPEFEEVNADFAAYDMNENAYGFKGSVATVGDRQALLLDAASVSSIETNIAATDAKRYEVKFSIRPEDKNQNSLVTFNGAVAYNATIANSTIYKIIGFQSKNLFGWSSNANAWGIGYNNNRLKIGYTAAQWYDVSMIIDHALNSASVTINAEDGNRWSYFMTGIPDGAYLKTLDFRNEGEANNCYIDDVSIKEYTGDYGYMTSCDGLFNEAGTTEITAFMDSNNYTGFADQSEGTKFTAKVNYINPTKDEQKLICMIAYYDWDEGIRTIEIAETKTIGAESAGCYMPVFTVPDMVDIRGVKILMWDSLINASPISSAMNPY